MSFPLAGTTDWEMYFGAVWSTGGPYCNLTGHGDGQTIKNADCQVALTSAIGDCDTGSTSQKYDGYTLNNCEVHIAGMDSTWISQTPTNDLTPTARSYATSWRGMHFVQY